jgi:hypothetical protein
MKKTRLVFSAFLLSSAFWISVVPSVFALSVISFVTDMDYNRVISLGDLYEHYYSNGAIETGIIHQGHLDLVIKEGYNSNKDGLIQKREFKAWLNGTTPHTWYVNLKNPSINSIVYDRDNDGVVSAGDSCRHYYNSTGYIKTGIIQKEYLNLVINNGYDTNGDSLVQVEEFQAMANGETYDTWSITIQTTQVFSVSSVIYDEDQSRVVSAGDIYMHKFYNSLNNITSTNKGKISQYHLNDVINKGYDENNDGLIQVTELQTYYNKETVHTWTIELAQAMKRPVADVYSFIYDHDEDGVVSVKDPYVHYFEDGKVGNGLIDRFQIIWALGYDNNSDKLVQVEEFQAALMDYTKDEWYIQLVEQKIDTSDYWPIKEGNYWIYEREGRPEQTTIISIVKDKYDNYAAYFKKSNKETYWSPGWNNVVLKWYLSWVNDYFAAANLKGDYSGYYDNAPDDIRYESENGSVIGKFWFVIGDNETIPPYVLYPKKLDVYKTDISITQKYYIEHSDGTRSHVLNTGWDVSYEWVYLKTKIGYEGKALRIMFNENEKVYEDWYIVEGIGPVQIDQYADKEKTILTMRIKIKEAFVQN